jgi:2-C-methyl-D-erythritol 4-phosphate cytidylyltransferase
MIAILVAAGRSLRFGADKLTALIGEKPVLAHSLLAFEHCTAVRGIVLVAREERHAEFAALAREHGISKLARLVAGGEERHLSVWNGLLAVKEWRLQMAMNQHLENEPSFILLNHHSKNKCVLNSANAPSEYECGFIKAFSKTKPASVNDMTDGAFVAVHDAARPLITPGAIEACLATARLHGASACAAPVSDTLKRADAAGRVTVENVDRAGLWAMQTPQIFRADWLKEAYTFMQGASSAFTDDASLLEAAGYKITLTDGSRENIKITEPPDWKIAEALRSLFV